MSRFEMLAAPPVDERRRLMIAPPTAAAPEFAAPRPGASFGDVPLHAQRARLEAGLEDDGLAHKVADDSDENDKEENGGGVVAAPPVAAPVAPAPAVAPPPPAVAPPAPAIHWSEARMRESGSRGSSTTTEEPFRIRYDAEKDGPAAVWRLRVRSIRGGARIVIRTGGSRNPFKRPPKTEAEAQDAVSVMKGYHARGSRGAWHTETASRLHELHHYREWKCAAEHYWGLTGAALHALTVPIAGHRTEGAAIRAMRARLGANLKMRRFKRAARAYWFLLSDSAGSRPYAAGQDALNIAVVYVQALAGMNGWSVDTGLVWPSTEPPCYEPFTPFVP